MKDTRQDGLIKGRGAQFNTHNRFLKNRVAKDEIEGIDDWQEKAISTQFIQQEAKSIVNKVDSPDVRMEYSMNPYAGCEHGCIYCFARNVHEYWGYSAGLDFETKIIVKKNAAQLLRKFLMHHNWQGTPIMMSGNTDCYQPAEQTYRLTRQLLEVCEAFRQPVGIITKNAGVIRDIDILGRLAKDRLVSVLFSITSLDEDLRRVLEPRTTTSKQKFNVMRQLTDAGIRVGVMMGPMIPGLNDHEMPSIMKAAKDHGAKFTAYTFIRLNGVLPALFKDWLYKTFPDRAEKIWHQMEQSHNGKVSDSRWGKRMRGEGNIADIIAQQYKKFGIRYGLNADEWSLNTSLFMRPGQQLNLF
jgi:DNA repair photolyase